MNRRHREISVVVADDHPIVLQGLVSLLRSYPETKVVAECRNGKDALEALKQFTPDIAVLDVAMPFLNGVEVLTQFGASARTKFVFLTATASDRQILSAVDRGAMGMLHKDTAPDELIQCIREVAHGQKWFSATVAEIISRGHANSAGDLEGELTSREQEVMQLACTGLSNKEIARKLTISEGTVKLHLHKIYDKLQVPNRTALTARFISERPVAA
jgi:DNA-binding NarL/FixJ family response regulator